MDESAVLKVIEEYLLDSLRIDPQQVRAETRFKEDLGMDSLSALELIVTLEDQVGVNLGLDRLPDVAAVASVGRLAAALSRATAARMDQSQGKDH